MTKKFFMKVSPKAAQGIFRVYESRGYEVHAKPQSDGDFVVVVMKGEPPKARGSMLSRFRKDRASADRAYG